MKRSSRSYCYKRPAPVVLIWRTCCKKCRENTPLCLRKTPPEQSCVSHTQQYKSPKFLLMFFFNLTQKSSVWCWGNILIRKALVPHACFFLSSKWFSDLNTEHQDEFLNLSPKMYFKNCWVISLKSKWIMVNYFIFLVATISFSSTQIMTNQSSRWTRFEMHF